MKSKNILYIVTGLIWIALSYSIFFVVPNEDKVIMLATEDGFFETAGAIWFLLSAIVFFTIFVKNRKNTDRFVIRYIFFFLLGVTFLFVFLEEISWGQRIFNIDTPQLFQELNIQKELNLHNLKLFHGSTEDGERKSFWALLLNFDRLFSFFWFTVFFLIPLFSTLTSKVKVFLERINFPITPLFLGTFFVLNYLLSKLIALNIESGLNHSLVEIKESNFALLIFLASIWLYKSKNNIIS